MKKFILAAGTTLLLFTTAFAQKSGTASLYLSNGNISGAKTVIDEVAANPEGAALAKTWLVKGDVYKEIYVSKVLFTTYPDALFVSKDAYFKAFELEINPKKKDAAAPGLKELVNYFYNEGVTYFQSGKYDPAYKNFKAQVEINEFLIKNSLETVVDTNAYYVLALTSFNTERYDEAIDATNKLISLNYKDENVYVIAAESYGKKGDKSKQMELVEVGRAKYPNNLDLLYKEINYYMELEKTDILIEKIESAIKLDPKNHSLYQALGSIFDKSGKKEEAIVQYDKAISLKPDMYEAYYNKATIYFDEAMKLVEKMNEENDNKKYEVLRVQKDAILKDKCLPLFEKAYELNPDDLMVRKALKEVYVRLNMMDKAMALPKY